MVKAVLSTTAKAKAKAAKKDAEKKAAEGGDTAMETEEDKDKPADDKKDADAERKEDKKAPEPTKEELANPARVTPAQERYVRFDEGSRFVPWWRTRRRTRAGSWCSGIPPLGRMWRTPSPPGRQPG